MAGKWEKIGSIRFNDKTGNMYIKIDDASKLHDGITLSLDKFEDETKRLNELGYLDEAELAKREETGKWLKYNIKIAPPKE